MHRHQLTDEQWSAVRDLLPKRTATTGRTPSDPRLMLDGILSILDRAPGVTCRPALAHGRRCTTTSAGGEGTGVFARIVEALQLRLDKQGLIDWDLWCVDGASVRAARAVACLKKLQESSRQWHPERAQGPRIGPQPRRVWERSSTWLLTAVELHWRSK